MVNLAWRRRLQLAGLLTQLLGHLPQARDGNSDAAARTVKVAP